jgi:CysZ protein
VSQAPVVPTPSLARAPAAVLGGLVDLVSPRLLPLSILCALGALAASLAGAWAAVHFLVPLIPDGSGALHWLLAALRLVASAGVVLFALWLSPTISMFIGGVFFDVAAARVERALDLPPGRSPSFVAGMIVALRIAVPALVLNVLTLPLVFVPFVHVPLFALLNGYLLGREYCLLAALRQVGWAEARDVHRRSSSSALAVGLVATFVPFVAPLFGASAFTRLLARRPG